MYQRIFFLFHGILTILSCKLVAVRLFSWNIYYGHDVALFTVKYYYLRSFLPFVTLLRMFALIFKKKKKNYSIRRDCAKNESIRYLRIDGFFMKFISSYLFKY